MQRIPMFAAATALVTIGIMGATDIAVARGGGGNVMSSPGYQRRLQESRGFVTSYSNGYAQRGPLYYYRHPHAYTPKPRTR